MRASPATRSSKSNATGIAELIARSWRKERPDLDLDNLMLTIYLMRLGSMVERTFGQTCEERWSVSGADMRVLFALRREGKPYAKRPTDLFRALVVTSGAVTKKVDRLEARGLVERLPDPAHGGGFLVQLTRKGIRMTDQAVEEVCNAPVLPGILSFSKTELTAARRFAARALAAAEQSLEPEDSEPAAAPAKGAGRAVNRTGKTAMKRVSKPAAKRK